MDQPVEKQKLFDKMEARKKHPLPTAEQEDVEEALSVIWQELEGGERSKKEILALLETGVSGEIYSLLLGQGFVRENASEVFLTEEGEKLARDVIRRNRLAERLLSDVLSLPSHLVDPNACKLEHIISREVSDSICALLGHPQQCPHGSPIPRGECCREETETLSPIILSLDKMEAGTKGRIAYLALQNHPHLHKLLSFGLVPGTLFNLHQTFPTYVMEVGETTIALEKEIAEKVFVRKAE